MSAAHGPPGWGRLPSDVFTLSKIMTFLVQPSTLALTAVFAGLALTRMGRAPRLAAILSWTGALLVLAAGFLPLGNWLVLPLEQRFSETRSPQPGDRVDGIIILGGFEDGWVTGGRGSLHLNMAAERLTEGVRLARAFPDARIVFTGGSGTLWRSGEVATGPVSDYLRSLGIAADRIVLEGKSRNTHENAVYTKKVLDPKPGERWILVTSAYHMPRAMGVFRKEGFDVVPYAVDYRTRGPEDATRMFDSVPAGFMRSDLAVKEWIGLVSYRVMGRTSQLLPGP